MHWGKYERPLTQRLGSRARGIPTCATCPNGQQNAKAIARAPEAEIVARGGVIETTRGAIETGGGEIGSGRGEIVPQAGEISPRHGEIVARDGEIVTRVGVIETRCGPVETPDGEIVAPCGGTFPRFDRTCRRLVETWNFPASEVVPGGRIELPTKGL